MGLFSREKPKIKIQTTKKDGFSGWLKCTHCNELIHTNELQQNQNCCPKCNNHYRLSAAERIKSLADPESFIELFRHYIPTDSLQFVDSEPYADRILEAQRKTGLDDSVIAGLCTINGYQTAL